MGTYIKKVGEQYRFQVEFDIPNLLTCPNGHKTFYLFGRQQNRHEIYVYCKECGWDAMLVVVSMTK